MMGRQFRDEKNSQLTLHHHPHRKSDERGGRIQHGSNNAKKVNGTPTISPLGLPALGGTKMGF